MFTYRTQGRAACKDISEGTEFADPSSKVIARVTNAIERKADRW